MNDEQVRKIVNEALAAQQKLFTQQIQQSTMFNRNIKIEQLKPNSKTRLIRELLGNWQMRNLTGKILATP